VTQPRYSAVRRGATREVVTNSREWVCRLPSDFPQDEVQGHGKEGAGEDRERPPPVGIKYPPFRWDAGWGVCTMRQRGAWCALSPHHHNRHHPDRRRLMAPYW
jgi:hypothetical protein